MNDEDEIPKVEILSTHELIQAQHFKNIGDVSRAAKEVEAEKIDDLTAIRIMLQGVMDKVKGLDAFVRQHINGINRQSRTFQGTRESDADEKHEPQSITQNPTLTDETNIRNS